MPQFSVNIDMQKSIELDTDFPVVIICDGLTHKNKQRFEAFVGEFSLKWMCFAGSMHASMLAARTVISPTNKQRTRGQLGPNIQHTLLGCAPMAHADSTAVNLERLLKSYCVLFGILPTNIVAIVTDGASNCTKVCITRA